MIHIRDIEQVLYSILVAKNYGADGVFLANPHNSSVKDLTDWHIRAKEVYPDYWIGLNVLQRRPLNVIANLPPKVPGLLTEQNIELYAEEVKTLRKKRLDKFLHFGGVSFHGQTQPAHPTSAAYKAMKYLDVVTTSGDRAGEAPPREKIRSMKDAIGNHPLAIAGGINTQNVPGFMPYTDCFIVGNSLMKAHSLFEFEPKKIQALAAVIHSHR